MNISVRPRASTRVKACPQFRRRSKVVTESIEELSIPDPDPTVIDCPAEQPVPLVVGGVAAEVVHIPPLPPPLQVRQPFHNCAADDECEGGSAVAIAIGQSQRDLSKDTADQRLVTESDPIAIDGSRKIEIKFAIKVIDLPQTCHTEGGEDRPCQRTSETALEFTQQQFQGSMMGLNIDDNNTDPFSGNHGDSSSSDCGISVMKSSARRRGGGGKNVTMTTERSHNNNNNNVRVSKTQRVVRTLTSTTTTTTTPIVGVSPMDPQVHYVTKRRQARRRENDEVNQISRNSTAGGRTNHDKRTIMMEETTNNGGSSERPSIVAPTTNHDGQESEKLSINSQDAPPKQNHDIESKRIVDHHPSVSKMKDDDTSDPAMVSKTKRGRSMKIEAGEILLNPQVAPNAKNRGKPKLEHDVEDASRNSHVTLQTTTKRGRTKKVHTRETLRNEDNTEETLPNQNVVPQRKKRGRPKKVDAGGALLNPQAAQETRTRGSPKKGNTEDARPHPQVVPQTKKRGRPKKVDIAPETKTRGSPKKGVTEEARPHPQVVPQIKKRGRQKKVDPEDTLLNPNVAPRTKKRGTPNTDNLERPPAKKSKAPVKRRGFRRPWKWLPCQECLACTRENDCGKCGQCNSGVGLCILRQCILPVRSEMQVVKILLSDDESLCSIESDISDLAWEEAFPKDEFGDLTREDLWRRWSKASFIGSEPIVANAQNGLSEPPICI